MQDLLVLGSGEGGGSTQEEKIREERYREDKRKRQDKEVRVEGKAGETDVERGLQYYREETETKAKERARGRRG